MKIKKVKDVFMREVIDSEINTYLNDELNAFVTIKNIKKTKGMESKVSVGEKPDRYAAHGYSDGGTGRQCDGWCHPVLPRPSRGSISGADHRGTQLCQPPGSDESGAAGAGLG